MLSVEITFSVQPLHGIFPYRPNVLLFREYKALRSIFTIFVTVPHKAHLYDYEDVDTIDAFSYTSSV